MHCDFPDFELSISIPRVFTARIVEFTKFLRFDVFVQLTRLRITGAKVSEERHSCIDLREQVQGVSQSPAQSPLESVRMFRGRE